MRILIVGAGIGGLTLAALLRRWGVQPDIIDRAPSFDHAGYMLGLYPLGSRVLHGLHVRRLRCRERADERLCRRQRQGRDHQPL